MFGGNLTGLLSGVLPHKVASPRGLALMWTPKIHGTIEIAARGLPLSVTRWASGQTLADESLAR